MHTRHLWIAAIILLFLPCLVVAETTITYQGQLRDGSGPYTGTPGMEFRLFDSLTGGAQIGTELILSAVPVTDGLFQVELDFGTAYGAGPRYLEVMVGGNTLAPRQRIAPAPLAVAALNVPEISLADLGCSTGEVPKWDGAVWTCASAVSAADLQIEKDRIDTLETENDALATRVDDLEVLVGDLADQLALLSDDSSDHDGRLTTIENSELLAREDFVVDLDEFLVLHRTAPADTAVHGPILRLTGANFQIINAAQDQITPDGTGNLVVGFSQARSEGGALCSDGTYDVQADCEGAGHTWALAHNSGSHNIVGGEWAAYSQTGGFVVGTVNAITGRGAAVLAGSHNSAIGLGGSSVTGGLGNTASGTLSSISGGSNNTASGGVSTVIGGRFNSASGPGSSVSGGEENTASGRISSVSGGNGNTASGEQSSVSGGDECEVDLTAGWGAKDASGTILGDCLNPVL